MRLVFVLYLSFLIQSASSQFLEATIDKPSPKITSLDARLVMKIDIKTNDTTFYVINSITNDNYKYLTDVFIILNQTKGSIQKLINDLELCIKHMNDTKTEFIINGESYEMRVYYDGYYGSQFVISSKQNDQYSTFKKSNVLRWIDWLKKVKNQL